MLPPPVGPEASIVLDRNLSADAVTSMLPPLPALPKARYLPDVWISCWVKCLIEPQKDYFGRYLGECFINNESVSAYMVRNGLAFDYPKYSKKKYSKDQIYAKNNKLGLWSMEFDYPWIWRKNNR